MSASNIPLAVTSLWYIANQQNSVARVGSQKNEYFSPDGPNFQFWVFNRSDPSGDIVYQGSASNASTPPSDLNQYLNDQHILVTAGAADNSRIPQGDLYQLLTENGAGPELQRLELASTTFYSAVIQKFVYQLVSIPGNGSPGIELFHNLVTTIDSAGTDFSVQTNPVSLILELIPTTGTTGTIYTPVRI